MRPEIGQFDISPACPFQVNQTFGELYEIAFPLLFVQLQTTARMSM